jgi:hypothetical protein
MVNMGITIGKNGSVRQNATVLIPLNLYEAAKNNKIKLSSLMERALEEELRGMGITVLPTPSPLPSSAQKTKNATRRATTLKGNEQYD